MRGRFVYFGKVADDPKGAAPRQLAVHYEAPRYVGKDTGDNPISKAMRKLLNRISVKRRGLSFYGLRRTFRTIADETNDQPAIDHIMGHADEADDMPATYRQRIDDARLLAVTNHVREWLSLSFFE